MQITRTNILKAALTLLGAIFVGAIGSGVWQELLGPGIRAIGNWILDAVSLVFRSFKNDIYAQIARDHYSAVNLESLSLVIALYAAMWVAFIFYFASRIRKNLEMQETLIQKIKDLRGRVEEDLHGKREPEMTRVQAEKNLEQVAENLKQLEERSKRTGNSMRLHWRSVYVIVRPLCAPKREFYSR